MGTFLSSSCLIMPCSSRAVRIKRASPPCWNLFLRKKILSLWNNHYFCIPCCSSDSMNIAVGVCWTIELNDPIYRRKIYQALQMMKIFIRMDFYLVLSQRYPLQIDMHIAFDRMYRRLTFVSSDPLCHKERVRANRDEVYTRHCREISPRKLIKLMHSMFSRYLFTALDENDKFRFEMIFNEWPEQTDLLWNFTNNVTLQKSKRKGLRLLIVSILTCVSLDGVLELAFSWADT